MMTINTVQSTQRPEPVAQTRRDPDDSFSGALQREMKNRGSDTTGADAAQTRRRDAERDQAKREEVRKHGDEGHGVDANPAALHAASTAEHEGQVNQADQTDQADSAVDGEVGPGDGIDELSVVRSTGDETSVGNTSEASDEHGVIGSGAEELVAGSSEGMPGGIAAGEQATDIVDVGSVERAAGEETPAGSGMTAAGTSAVSTVASDSQPGSDAGPTAASQGDGVGQDSRTVDATGVDIAVAGGDSVEAGDGGIVGSAGASGTGGSKDLLNASVAGAPVATADAPDAATNKVTAKAAPAAEMANVAHAVGSIASNQAAPAASDTAAPAVVATAHTGGFDMSKLGEGIATRLRNGERVQSLSLELHPAELGAVRVDVRQIDGVAHLVLTADRQAGGQRLAAAMADLRHDLERAGVDIGDLQLRQDSSGGGQDHRGGSSDRIVTNPRTGTTGSVIQPPIVVRRSTQLAGSQQRIAIDL